MRASINQTLDFLEQMLEPGASRTRNTHSELKKKIDGVQDAYVEVIQQAVSLLMQGRLDDSHTLLQGQRDDLASTLERIGTLIDDISEENEPLIKAAVEYLFTRARLVDELKMFPNIGIELLEHVSLDDNPNHSIDALVEYMETAMTGKKNLYARVANALT